MSASAIHSNAVAVERAGRRRRRLERALPAARATARHARRRRDEQRLDEQRQPLLGLAEDDRRALAGEHLGAQLLAAIASRYICAMASVLASRSAATLSWVSARSHSPITHSSWNRNTRRSASAGWRAHLHPAGRAAPRRGRPRARRVRQLHETCGRSRDIARVTRSRRARWSRTRWRRRRAPPVAILRRVADSDLREPEAHALDHFRFVGQAASSWPPWRRHADVFELDPEVLERRRRRPCGRVNTALAYGSDQLIVVVAQETHQRRRALIDALDDPQLADAYRAGRLTRR